MIAISVSTIIPFSLLFKQLIFLEKSVFTLLQYVYLMQISRRKIINAIFCASFCL